MFTDYLTLHAPDVPFIRFAPPTTAQEQLAVVSDRAVFLQLVPGDINRHQQTYGTLYVARTWDKSKYTPGFSPDIWLVEFTNHLQAYLNEGKDTFRHLFPLYNVIDLLPVGAYDAMLASGDTAEIAANLPSLPSIVKNTGFIVKTGHAKPSVNIKQNPMLWEMAVVFEHWAYDVWSDQRG